MRSNTGYGGSAVLASRSSRAFLGILTTFMLVFSLVAMAPPAGATTEECPDHNGHPGKVESGDMNDITLDAGTSFCVKGSTDASGTLIADGETTLSEYLGNDHDVSYYVVYSVGTDEPEDSAAVNFAYNCLAPVDGDYLVWDGKMNVVKDESSVHWFRVFYAGGDLDAENVKLVQKSNGSDEIPIGTLSPGESVLVFWTGETGSSFDVVWDGGTKGRHTASGTLCAAVPETEQPNNTEDDGTTSNDEPTVQVLAEELENEEPCFDGTAENEGDACVTANEPDVEVEVLGIQIENTTTTTVSPVTAGTLPFTGDDTGIHLMWALWAIVAGIGALVMGAQRSPASVKAGRSEDTSTIRRWMQR